MDECEEDGKEARLWESGPEQLTTTTSFWVQKNAASWNRRIGRVWPPVMTHKPGSTSLPTITLLITSLLMHVKI